jgi:glycosyltransferase involved in cell wall biosynthesis
LVATISKGLSDKIFEHFNLKRRPYTINTALPSRYVCDKLPLRKPGKIVICIARFDSQKDHLLLLTSFKTVVNTLPDSELWLVGDGPLKEDLQQLTSQLNIVNNVKFLGFGLVILEAMSRGIPVIASDCEFGPSEILDKGNYGLLTPVGDSSSLAKSLIRLLTDKKLNNHYSKFGFNRSKDYSRKKSMIDYKKLIVSAALNKIPY